MHVHFIAIAGTGMGSLAGLLKSRGHRVTGSDENVYPPMSEALARWGIPVSLGFRPENVRDHPPDLVVIGNAVRPDNPEARAALEAGLAYRSFPDALAEFAIGDRHAVVVTGTHGKTTTASLIATLLLETGRDPSLLVGGIAANFDGSFRDGGGPEFVVEGDEYDTAFFDKTPKFLHYRARTCVLTSIEFDHADIYRDLAHVQGEFRKLVQSLPPDGTLVAATDDPRAAEVAAEAPCAVRPYGVELPGPGLSAEALEVGSEGTRFELRVDGAPGPRAFLPMHGRHNVANALAALAVLESRGVPLEAAVAALPAFRGVRRRQELRGEAGGVLVIDDFAHHPTAVRETLAGLRARFPERRLFAVFEPCSNTSRRAVFQQRYAEAFDAADRVLIAQVPDAPLYSAFADEAIERLDTARLARELSARGRPARALEGVAALVDELARTCRPGDVVVTLSNGGFDGIWERLLTRLAAAAAEGPR